MGTTTIDVGSELELNQAIASADAATSGSFDIVFTQGITEGTDVGQHITFGTQTLSAPPDLYALNLASGVSVTIDGGGHTLDGNGLYRGLFAYAGSLTVEDLTIADAKAAGGVGGAGVLGGGAGLGGGLFVAAGATVMADGVDFTGDSAVGGNGGADSGELSGAGGGLGGAGGAVIGGGGGVGASAAGAGYYGSPGSGGPGIVLGAAAGGTGSSSGGVYGGGGGWSGGGGVGGGSGSVSDGGAGGFGGGGGIGALASGAGGFGGGGAGGVHPGAGGFGGGGGGGETAGGGGGFGAGHGGTAASLGGGGGGGLGAGGDVFVQQGGALTIEGGSLSGGSAKGGTGSVGAASGTAYAGGIFLEGTASVTLAPLSGQTLSLGDALADQSIAGGTQPAAAVTVDGPGTVVASGNFTVAKLDVAGGGVLQLAGVTVATDPLTIDRGGSFGGYGTVDGGITNDGSLFASGGTLDLTGAVSGTGAMRIDPVRNWRWAGRSAPSRPSRSAAPRACWRPARPRWAG